MIKKLARLILKEELTEKDFKIKGLERCVESDSLNINRLSKIINLLKDDLTAKRGYVFEAEKLTANERLTLGKHHDHEVVAILKKWFKQKADENADLLYHGQKEPESIRLAWELAVRIYDDLNLQIDTCMKMFDKECNRKEVEKKKKKEVKVSRGGFQEK